MKDIDGHSKSKRERQKKNKNLTSRPRWAEREKETLIFLWNTLSVRAQEVAPRPPLVGYWTTRFTHASMQQSHTSPQRDRSDWLIDISITTQKQNTHNKLLLLLLLLCPSKTTFERGPRPLLPRKQGRAFGWWNRDTFNSTHAKTTTTTRKLTPKEDKQN